MKTEMKARLLLESLFRVSGEPKKALVIETETRRKLTSNMKNAQMNNAIAFSQLAEKFEKKEIVWNHIDRIKQKYEH